MNNQRRAFIVISSVLLGSFFAFLLVRSRMGTLKPNDWFQLAFNFLFAVAIVIGIGILFKKMKHKNPKD